MLGPVTLNSRRAHRGKVGAGKSLLRRSWRQAPVTVVFAQDHWMTRFHSDELKTIADYKPDADDYDLVVFPHVAEIFPPGLAYPAHSTRSGTKGSDDRLCPERSPGLPSGSGAISVFFGRKQADSAGAGARVGCF